MQLPKQMTENGALARTALAQLVHRDGSLSCPLPQQIIDDMTAISAADIADIAHFLTIIHGRHPGVIDHAATKIVEHSAREWLVQAMDGFITERAFLTRLTVAAGPITNAAPGAEASTSAVLGLAKAMDLLAQSDRRGCALGASLALVLDWWTLRPALNAIALRIGMEPPQCRLPEYSATATLGEDLLDEPERERAIGFGARQLLMQHKGLWTLLDSRSKQRREH
jgi:hypothetical protein